ncbi:DUF2264 domain-containing protein [Microbacterium sp. R86528]|uniref:DUF2264 domain-containing protein n=1 Tax=Microbacterium sp. R86528 TaxID=3093864 RepID=UPI0037CAF5FE
MTATSDVRLPPFSANGLNLALRVTPPEDRTLSPFTGLTREHWVATANDLLDSAARFRSSSGSRYAFPGRPSRQGTLVDGLEGFARTFLLAAFLSIGEPGEASQRHLDRYVAGLIAGTSANGDSECWPPIGHVEGSGGQAQVEAASIALSLHLTLDTTWARLTPAEKDAVANWLRPALDKETSPNNWYLFRVTIAAFLEAVDRGDAQTRATIERGLDLIEDWYRGRGWYSDGDGEAFDHYVGWALHLYPMLYARLSGNGDLLSKFGERLREFLEPFSHTFDRNGAPLYMGRSMTYRTATVAAISLGAITGHTPLSPGQSRRIASANLRYFFEREATTDGVFNSGWHGAHEATLQRYSGPGSPFWASKGFSSLMLPAQHPFWTDTECALPGDTADFIDAIAPVGLMVQATAADGIARVHNHGSDNIKPHDPDAGAPDPLYARFAYSTRTGPTALHNPSDNDFQIQYRDVWSARRRIHNAGSGANWIASWHHPRFPKFTPLPASDDAGHGSLFPSARVQSVTVAQGNLEVRIHRLRFPPPSSPVRVSGWAIADARPEDIRQTITGNSSQVRNAEGLSSQLLALHGFAENASASAASWGTAFGRWAMLPELHSSTHESLFVYAVSLSGSADALPLQNRVRADVTGALITVEWLEHASATAINLDDLDWGHRRPLC